MQLQWNSMYKAHKTIRKAHLSLQQWVSNTSPQVRYSAISGKETRSKAHSMCTCPREGTKQGILPTRPAPTRFGLSLLLGVVL
ncbi:hypothetical protein FKM82_027559 [Ascaphus truei]